MAGIARKAIVRLHPNQPAAYPDVNVPNTAPAECIDPIHDICSNVIGPPLNGVSADPSNTNAGVTQPRLAPCENANKFAAQKW